MEKFSEQKQLYNHSDRWNPLTKEESEHNERTRVRLDRLSDMGLELFPDVSFGVSRVVSGLYIEKVWNLSDKEFDEYLKWMESVIEQKK